MRRPSERLGNARPPSGLGRLHVAAVVLAWLIIAGMVGFVLAPTLTHAAMGGGHDWEQMESHRYLVTKTIRDYHQFPFWNPYSCGGHPNWAGFESGVTVVSPWLPFYLSLTLAHAMRVELFGSALIAALGAWLLAGRFTKSPALRALVVVAFAVNGRWTLQIAVGHTWHLAYAWTPWVLYFYDRAVSTSPKRRALLVREVALTGAVLAIMFYTGGIYPLPQTLAVLALCGGFSAVLMHSFRPLLVALAAGVLSFGLAAPKLLPLVDLLWHHPRLIDSTETLDLGAFLQILTAHDQDIGSRPANVSQWGWHEWGMYVGWPIVLAVFAGCTSARGVREASFKWAGLVTTLLGFGAFDPHAPWTLLHQLPVFKSQHVPSRWLYPALLLLLIVTAGVFDRALRRLGALRGWLEVALLGGVAWVAYDIAQVARVPMTHALTMPMPVVEPSTGPFHTEVHLPPELGYSGGWEPASLPAEMANIGTIDCGTSPALHNYVRGADGRVAGLGARGRGDPAYKGEVFLAEGIGDARIVGWTPNRMTVEVKSARKGELVVLNQNWDPGWSANGATAVNWVDTVAARLQGSEATVVFLYRPRFWYAGLFLFLSTLAGVAYAYRSARSAARREAAAS
ncbi:MAG: hypothetical protein M3O36_19430 [Myxococcota bacterium]|nr:hypothetical protein [Myxococcota bacterium]